MDKNTPLTDNREQANIPGPETASRDPRIGAELTRYYSGIDWGTILMRLLEKIHWIVLAALIGAAAMWFYTSRMVTPIYQAISKIYIAGSDTTISLSDLQLGSSLATDYQEVFRIWHIHEMVDERLDLNYSYSQLSDMVTVSNPSGSHFLYIYVRSPDPEEAKLLADTYAEVVQEYISVRMELRKPQILEKARLPYAPISPNIRASVIRGFMIGGAGMLAILVFFFLMDDRIRSSDDILKAVDLPTFGHITRQNMERNAQEEEAPNPVRGSPPAGSAPYAEIQGNLALDYSGEEAINTICSSLSFVGPVLKRVMITSCRAHEGKSFTAMQIAIGMTRRGKRVLLMDVDLRMSVLRSRYGIRLSGREVGLAHLLSGQCTLEEALYETNIPNLTLLPDGSSVKTPLTLLTAPHFARLMDSLAERFDLVVVDTPPLNAVVDAAEIARHCDGSLIVLEYNQTHIKALRETVEMLRTAGKPPLGCIINKENLSRLAKGRYSNYYYYGGKYGYGYRKQEGDSHKKRSLSFKRNHKS